MDRNDEEFCKPCNLKLCLIYFSTCPIYFFMTGCKKYPSVYFYFNRLTKFKEENSNTVVFQYTGWEFKVILKLAR